LRYLTSINKRTKKPEKLSLRQFFFKSGFYCTRLKMAVLYLLCFSTDICQKMREHYISKKNIFLKNSASKFALISTGSLREKGRAFGKVLLV
jgi:ribosomal protein L33